MCWLASPRSWWICFACFLISSSPCQFPSPSTLLINDIFYGGGPAAFCLSPLIFWPLAGHEQSQRKRVTETDLGTHTWHSFPPLFLLNSIWHYFLPHHFCSVLFSDQFTSELHRQKSIALHFLRSLRASFEAAAAARVSLEPALELVPINGTSFFPLVHIVPLHILRMCRRRRQGLCQLDHRICNCITIMSARLLIQLSIVLGSVFSPSFSLSISSVPLSASLCLLLSVCLHFCFRFHLLFLFLSFFLLICAASVRQK